MIGQAKAQEAKTALLAKQLQPELITVVAGFLLCFIASFLLCFCQNIRQSVSGTTLLFDSGHYLETCRLICLYWHQAWTSQHFPVASAKLVDYLMLDGPTFPGLMALICTICAKVPTQADWRLFICIQSFLQAVSTGLVYLLAKKFTGSIKWAVVAGLIWGFYPAAIVASQRIVSETLTTVLLLSLVLLLSEEFALRGSGIMRTIAAGICDVLLLLTKPAVILAWLFVNACALLQIDQASKKAVFALCLTASCLLALMPWLAFTYVNLGKVQVMPQRLPAYNVLAGSDLESDGWSTYPANAATALYCQSDGALPVALGIWRHNPMASLNLALRKIPRLWSLPWNDFRYKVLGMPISVQAYWHRLLIMLGLAGLLAALSGIQAKGAKAKDINFIAQASLSVVVGHFVYLPFECLSRYGFTAMPFVVLLAVYLLALVSQAQMFVRAFFRLLLPTLLLLFWSSSDLMPFCNRLLPEPRYAFWFYLAMVWLLIVLWALCFYTCLKDMDKASLPVSLQSFPRWPFYAGGLLVASMFGLVVLAEATNTLPFGEWSCKLKAGESVCRTIDLKPVVKDGKNLAFALVLVDGDAGLNGAIVKVNGRTVADKVSSVYDFYPARYQLLNVMQQTAAALNKSPDDMRQWRAVPVPLSWINLEGENTIEVCPGINGRATIFGDYQMLPGKKRNFMSLDYVSHARLWRSVDSLESRIPDPLGLPMVKSTCWLSSAAGKNYGDLSPAPGVQTGEYRLYLVLGTKHPGIAYKLPPATQTPAPLYQQHLQANSFQLPITADQKLGEIVLCQAKHAPGVVSTLSLPSAVTADSHLQISITGRVRAKNGPAVINIVAVLQGPVSRNNDIVLPATPKAILADNSWRPFAVNDVVPTKAVVGGAEAIRLEIYPQGDLILQALTVTVAPAHKPVFAGRNGPTTAISIL